MNREHWLEWTDLTKEDIEWLISAVHPYLVSMEEKNNWDATMNEEKFQSFLFQAFFQMIEVLEKILDPERVEDIDFYAYYPKIDLFLDCENDIEHVQCTSVYKVMKSYNTTTIYETIEKWWHIISEYLE